MQNNPSVGNPLLLQGRIVQRNFYNSGFDFRIDSILRIRSTQADNITKCKFTSFFIKLFETAKTISGIAKHFTHLCYAAKLATQLQKFLFRFNDFLWFFCTLCKKWEWNIRNPCAVKSQSGIIGRDAPFYSV